MLSKNKIGFNFARLLAVKTFHIFADPINSISMVEKLFWGACFLSDSYLSVQHIFVIESFNSLALDGCKYL